MMNITKSALLAAGALGLLLTGSSAQENGPGPYDNGDRGQPPSDYGPGPSDDYGPPPPAYDENYAGAPPENVIVIAPRYSRLPNGLIPDEATRASLAVSYSDLDLRTARGAHELRARVRGAAQSVCEELEARFRSALTTMDSCYRDAAAGALTRADRAISDARHYAYYEGYRE
jgi:UrcA family protein